MSEDSIERVNSLLASKLEKVKSRTTIQDADLQSLTGNTKLEGKHSFRNVLSRYLEDVNTLQHDADAEIQRLAAGETEDVHEVILAMDEAETAFELMMEIRNKLVSSYKEIMNMQV